MRDELEFFIYRKAREERKEIYNQFKKNLIIYWRIRSSLFCKMAFLSIHLTLIVTIAFFLRTKNSKISASKFPKIPKFNRSI